jgi:uncharacterized membrane protein HdeD (DUF308 family)
MEIISVPLIMLIVYGIIEILKSCITNSKFNNFIPIIAGILGGILGVVAVFVSPSILPTTNIFYAFLIGMSSGLSATGSNQIIKQLKELANINNSNNTTTNLKD